MSPKSWTLTSPSEGGNSAEELALITARALGELVSGLAWKRDRSSLGEDRSQGAPRDCPSVPLTDAEGRVV